MIRRALVSGAFSAAVLGGAIAACVGDAADATVVVQGDASDSDASVGAATEPCYANGTCNAGLSCFSGVCVAVDSGGITPTDSGGSGGTDSGSTSDAAADAGGGCECDETTNICGNFGALAGSCTYTALSGYCFGASPACYTSDNCDDRQFTCRSSADCAGSPNGSICCLNLNVSAATCGTAVPFSNPVTSCATTCDSADESYFLCTTESDCQKIDARFNHCTALVARAASGTNTQTVGVCVQM